MSDTEDMTANNTDLTADIVDLTREADLEQRVDSTADYNATTSEQISSIQLALDTFLSGPSYTYPLTSSSSLSCTVSYSPLSV